MSTETQQPSPFAATVGRMIGEFERSGHRAGSCLSKGDVAALRRMDVNRPDSAFFRLMASVSHDDTPDAHDARWAVVAKAMAMMAPHHHAAGVKPGQALRDSGFSASSDLRISRLLKAEGEAFTDYLLSAVRFLANKARPVNWFSFAELVFFQNDKARNRLAREFYSFKKD